MRKIASVVFGIMVMIGWAVSACASSNPSFRGTELDPVRPVPEFTLTDQNGEPFRMGDLRGSVALLFFGYTFCPDVCPTTLGTWKRVYEDLGDDVQDVRFVFITVDPDRDTPERLKQHVEIFNPDFVGLTGTPQELQPVYSAFGVYFERDRETESAAGYLVNHTASAFVVDPQGGWRLKHRFGTSAEDIVHDIKQLLQ